MYVSLKRVRCTTKILFIDRYRSLKFEIPILPNVFFLYNELTEFDTSISLDSVCFHL